MKRIEERELRRLPSRDVERIVRVIESLGESPRPTGCHKLATGDGFRVRQGDYRILYTIDDEARVIEIYKIGHRRDVYR
ncbi:MAG: type II toxin-antitoxin system RelE/ParE family toxin [Acidobacteria bacterium]|nr:type II toxin-antitoxin system RelE/ParE family toxin [Acidobacteriota bacterium]MCL5288359.1 type II toxin-antitoxin system RelE/ParE family toxin [Acidobacteriota bacterium]